MPPLLPSGRILNNRYRIHRTLFQSRLGNIYLAFDEHMRGNMWVVKEISVSASAGYNFLEEARQLQMLEHPNLPKIVDFFSSGYNVYLIREFVSGSDLASILVNRRILPEIEIINIGIQLCDLVMYLQKYKWSLQNYRWTSAIYRNLKLSNIVVMADGCIKILDIGYGSVENYNNLFSASYSAPEQFTGEFVNETQTVVYNIGALLYHLLTNIDPANSAPQNLSPLGMLRQGLTPATKNIIEKAISTHPSSRPKTFKDLRYGLDRAYNAAARLSGKSGSQSGRVYSGQGTGTPTWVWVLSGLTTALLGCALVILYKMFF